ncbi:MAG: Toluene-4-sulfonate monooxygenase system iron-sulfur subunit TsaM1, partial [Pseudomonadota bacterium]
MFLKNAWYVACQAHEITDKPLGRKICNESMAFYKNAEGRVSAVQDFCPHRGAPLSL